jgi:hypothetical protein
VQGTTNERDSVENSFDIIDEPRKPIKPLAARGSRTDRTIGCHGAMRALLMRADWNLRVAKDDVIDTIGWGGMPGAGIGWLEAETDK